MIERNDIEKGIRSGIRDLIILAVQKAGKTREQIEERMPEIKFGILKHPDMIVFMQEARLTEDDSIKLINEAVDGVLAETEW